MYIFSTFRHTNYLEAAINDLEKSGIKKKDIFAIPLDSNTIRKKVIDTIYYSDGRSLIDCAAILATIFMLLGVIYGYYLKWGPILWGLIGLITGAVTGFLIDLIPKKSDTSWHTASSWGVILIVKCENNLEDIVKKFLLENHALGIARYEKDNL